MVIGLGGICNYAAIVKIRTKTGMTECTSFTSAYPALPGASSFGKNRPGRFFPDAATLASSLPPL